MDLTYRRFFIRTNLFMGLYSAINLAAIAGIFDHVGFIGARILAVAVALPIAGQIWATLAHMRDSDEFVRGIMAKRFIISSGVSMALFSTWGFLESYAQAWHAPGWLIIPLFWVSFGFVSPFVRSTH
jgi:hypothetical protein